jgi:DNA-3-methyladenine glycosylase II
MTLLMESKELLGNPGTFNVDNYHTLCDNLAARDADLACVLRIHGYPPVWTRTNSFETLVHIILEQQVSLASTLAALKKLKEKTVRLTPDTILKLTGEEMRACYVSRQKSGYIRGLAEALINGSLDLLRFWHMDNDGVRDNLTRLKGIGNWSADVYLMFVLQRADVFPIGDLAAVNAIKRLKKLPKTATREDVLETVENWRPYRTIASMMLWHYYLSNTGRR